MMGEVRESSGNAQRSPRCAPNHTPAGPRVELANAGDHALIRELLLAAGLAVSHNEFQATLEDPLYEPTDRLLIRESGRIVSHLLLTKRSVRFGSVALPVVDLKQLATRPECRGRGYARTLMATADARMASEDAPLGMLRTSQPKHLEPLGWCTVGRTSYRRTSVHELLAKLKEIAPPRTRARSLSVRVWRQFELPSLASLYDQATSGQYGALVRSEQHWRWLIGRQAYDQILVAIQGHDSLGFGEAQPTIVGYAILGGDRLIELFVDPGCESAATALLERAGREAMEQDATVLMLAPPPANQADHLPTNLEYGEALPGPVTMLKVVQPDALARQLFDEFRQRAVTGGVDIPCTFTLQLGLNNYRFVLTRRAARIEPCDPSETPDLVAATNLLGRLLSGQVPVSPGGSEGDELIARNDHLANQISALFPPLAFWRSAFDDLEAK